MEQATVVSDLKNQLVERRHDIANNLTPDASDDEGPAPTPEAAPLVPSLAPLPGVPPENTPLDPAKDDMDDDSLGDPLATKRKGEFGAVQVPATTQEFQQWTAGLDRESVREALAQFSSPE